MQVSLYIYRYYSASYYTLLDFSLNYNLNVFSAIGSIYILILTTYNSHNIQLGIFQTFPSYYQRQRIYIYDVTNAGKFYMDTQYLAFMDETKIVTFQ